MSLAFVVGTGRCGSTMLSRVLNTHPDVLSVSECWNILRYTDDQGKDQLPTRPMSGEEFWRELDRPDTRLDAMLRSGMKSDEDFYPYGRGRFDLVSGTPRIARLLAATSDDPDALYDRFADQVPTWPTRPVMAHARAFFTEFAAGLGRSVTVERTGGGLVFLPVLRAHFPEARYVFLYRDGVDSAVSMSRHPAFRFAALRELARVAGTQELAGLPSSADVAAVRPEDIESLINPPFDRERFMAYPIPPAYFGWSWASQIRPGAAEMATVPHPLWTTMRYENLLREPRAELARLAGFLAVPAREQWLERSAAFIDGGRTRSARSRLHPAAFTELRGVCASGAQAFEALEALEAEHAAAVKFPQ